MKLSCIVPTAILAATAANANPAVGSVKITGNDAGLCDFFGLSPGCDASFNVHAYLYEDGSVGGNVIDTAQGSTKLEGVPDCIRFLGDGKAIVTGTVTTSNIQWIQPGDPFQVAGKQAEQDLYSPFRTISRGFDCNDNGLLHFFSDRQLVEHYSGHVEVLEPPTRRNLRN